MKVSYVDTIGHKSPSYPRLMMSYSYSDKLIVLALGPAGKDDRFKAIQLTPHPAAEVEVFYRPDFVEFEGSITLEND